jgi:hypothetical protein
MIRTPFQVQGSEEDIMLLHVNDMGFVPDGRFLERASIAAGSSVLTDPDGNLRATDIAKNIAVPGAIDLVAPIAALVDRKDVANASMDAGSQTLTALLPPGEGFRDELNLHQSITVAGAGPGGETLVTEVVQVTPPQHSEIGQGGRDYGYRRRSDFEPGRPRRPRQSRPRQRRRSDG